MVSKLCSTRHDLSYRFLLLSCSYREVELVSKQPQDSLSRVDDCRVKLILEITFLPYWAADGKFDKLFIEIWETHFFTPVRHDTIVSAEITLSNPADI